MILGKTNSKPNTACRAPAQSSHECVGAGFLAAASRCPGGRWTLLNRDGVVTAASQRHRPADPVWACQLNEGEESTGQSKNTGMIYSKRSNKTHPSLDRKATISQTTFSNEFTWIKSFIIWFNFYWCLFLRAQLTNKSALVDKKSMLVQEIDWHRVGDKPLPDTVHCRIEGVGMSWRGLTRINI